LGLYLCLALAYCCGWAVKSTGRHTFMAGGILGTEGIAQVMGD